MQLLDLNLDAIEHIRGYLGLIDLTKLSSTCSGLRYLFPAIEAQQHMRFRKVRDEINAIAYMYYPQYPGSRGYSSVRIRDRVKIEYKYSTEMTILWINYEFPQHDDPLRCPLDGGYPDTRRYQRFRTSVDSSMWYAKNNDRYAGVIERRQLPCAPVKISVGVSRYDYTQTLEICESSWYINDKPKHYPPWVDEFAIKPIQN